METRIRQATQNDLLDIIKLLAGDVFGSQREKYEDPLPPSYLEAFQHIEKDPHNEVYVLEYKGEIVGTVQLSMIPHLSHQGSWRAQLESLAIRSDLRRQGLGTAFVNEIIELAREKGARIIQLTSNKARTRAVKFYEKLGFVCSHEGLKLTL